MPRIWTSIKGPNNKKWKIRELSINAPPSLLDCLRQDYHGTRTDTDGGGGDGGSNKGNVRGRLIKLDTRHAKIRKLFTAGESHNDWPVPCLAMVGEDRLMKYTSPSLETSPLSFQFE